MKISHPQEFRMQCKRDKRKRPNSVSEQAQLVIHLALWKRQPKFPNKNSTFHTSKLTGCVEKCYYCSSDPDPVQMPSVNEPFPSILCTYICLWCWQIIYLLYHCSTLHAGTTGLRIWKLHTLTLSVVRKLYPRALVHVSLSSPYNWMSEIQRTAFGINIVLQLCVGSNEVAYEVSNEPDKRVAME